MSFYRSSSNWDVQGISTKQFHSYKEKLIGLVIDKRKTSIKWDRFCCNVSWVLSRSSFLFGNLGNSSLELLLNLRSKASSSLSPCPLTGISHLLLGICPCPDLNVAWIWGKILSLAASLMALWIWGTYGAHDITHLLGNSLIQFPWQSKKLTVRICFPQILAILSISFNFSFSRVRMRFSILIHWSIITRTIRPSAKVARIVFLSL